MNKTVRKILNIATTVLVALVVIFALLLVGARLVGFDVYAVLSGSMEPEYPVGSLIFVKEIDPMELEVGDVITFMADEDTVATHRIIEILPDQEDPDVLRFRTKGDANKIEDGSAVHCKNIIGTPVFDIPLLGYVSNYIQQPPGLYVAIIIGVALLILVFLPDIMSIGKKTPKQQDDDAGSKGDNDDMASAPQS